MAIEEREVRGQKVKWNTETGGPLATVLEESPMTKKAPAAKEAPAPKEAQVTKKAPKADS